MAIAQSRQPMFILPNWPAPSNVRAAVTTRVGGVSIGPYAELNLAMHVGDDPRAVVENRRRVREALRLPAEPTWLNQVHGTHVVTAGAYSQPPTADASIARSAGAVCVVLTADCLPVLFCDEGGTCVAAAHAGWRGLASGILGETVAALGCAPHSLLAWLGPAIEQDAFEVGDEVREQFLARNRAHDSAFVRNARGRWQADLYALARTELTCLGVTRIFGGGFGCFADAKRFFSYRRENRTGRMGTFIWREQ
ncbi:MAG: peptidoglycan editing factor PgeF [Gammaproteobacteria bacterium]|nr:peptidoglycan editing factor PgeF [Gammaproteobacteria bacterium]